MSIGAEMRFIDQLSVSRSGIVRPKGHTREVQHPHIDFLTCVETIRVLMASGNYYRSQSYATDFTGALVIREGIIFSFGHRTLDSGGFGFHDDAMRRRRLYESCGELFSFEFPRDYMSAQTGPPVEDFTIIAISEVLSFISFL